ncbi:HlyD family secretion protein, partial [Streptococcus agalactiae]|uniref:HlyD family efflux transporter periplasmic adaptor subunit n=2 Tax=Bacteria TaxID=2 RepID=UPI0020C164E3
DGLVGNAEVEQARAAAATAGATRSSLAQRTASLALTAPSAGIVQAVTGSPGDLVQPGASIATIVRDGDVRARFGIDPAIARSLRPGQPIRIEGN